MTAAVSIRPLPKALATLTFPATMASTRPGTPKSESPRNSRGSQKLSSTRRKITSTCSSPSTVFRIDAPVAHREIGPSDQSEPEVAGDIRVFEVGLVVRPGREQYDSRIVALGKAGERFALCTEERSKAQYVRGAKEIRQNIGNNGAVLQCVAAARGCLCAIGQHPPLAVRRTRKINRYHMQIAVRGDAHAHQRPKECGIREE